MDESGQIHSLSSSPTVSYNDVQRAWTRAGGTDNINTDPLFVDADDADNLLGANNDAPCLSACSLCIDSEVMVVIFNKATTVCNYK